MQKVRRDTRPVCSSVVPLVCAAAIVLLPTVPGCHTSARRFAEALENKPAPDFALDDLEGNAVRLSDLRGKPVVLAFFAYG